MPDLPELKYWVEDSELTQLSRAHAGDAGLDVRCSEKSVTVLAGKHRLVATGLHLAIPEGWAGILKSRSGLAVSRGIEVGAGVIDSAYRGAVGVLLHNHGSSDVTYVRGDRIAQLVLIRVEDLPLVRVGSEEELGDSERGGSGYGSSGLQ